MEPHELRIIELFAGIGAQASALERLGIPFTSTVCEIDKHAYNAYCAIHGPTPNLGDITQVEHLPECDLVTYSFPCQDLSVAGNKKGMDEGSGTRSSLLWEVGRLLADMKEREVLPEVLLMENVDAILNKVNIDNFNKWIKVLDDLGYTSSYAVLNAKDYGVPQNRKRCFMVSTLHKGKFIFPEGRPLDKRLKDVLEDDVPESYYLSEERIATYERHKERSVQNGLGFGWSPANPERERVDCGADESPEGSHDERDSPSERPRESDGIEVVGDLNRSEYQDRMNRVYGTDGIAPTMISQSGGGMQPKIEITGSVHAGSFARHSLVIGGGGISPTILAHIGKYMEDSPKIEVRQ